MSGDKPRCLDAGMNDYVGKPINQQELLDKVRFWAQCNGNGGDAKEFAH